jgi:lipopolysaccharide export system permease protein
MRLLDRYVLRTFLKVFVMSLLAFGAGVVALDFFGRVSYFLDPRRVEGTFAEGYSSLGLILRFYAAYLPFLLEQVMPLVTAAAGLFTVSQLLSGNEVAPVVAGGTSARRLFLPLLLASLAVSVGHLAFQEVAVPALTREQIALKRFFAGDRQRGIRDLPHLRDGRGSVTHAGWYGFADRALEEVVVQRPWERRGGEAIGFEIWKAARLLPSGDRWVAPEGVEIQPPGVDSLPRRLPAGSPVDLGVSPEEVDALAAKKGAADLPLKQLHALAAKFPGRRHLIVAFHKQIARPLASFAMLLVGIPVLLSAGRSYFLGGAIAFGLSAAYYFLDIFFTSLGDRGDLPPLFAAYFPLAVLLSFGIARTATVTT